MKNFVKITNGNFTILDEAISLDDGEVVQVTKNYIDPISKKPIENPLRNKVKD